MSTLRITRRTFVAETTLAGLVTVAGRGILASPAWAAGVAKVGETAPVFNTAATNGRSVGLADQRGKIVILEWTNHDCPYVRKHYESGNMQTLQKEITAQGVVWLTLISSSPGTQGYVSPKEADELTASRKANDRRCRQGVRRDEYPAHVHRRQGRTARLRWRDRRPANDSPRRCPGRAQLRSRRARGHGRRARGANTGHARLRLHGQVRVELTGA
jgi:hypothetical protein